MSALEFPPRRHNTAAHRAQAILIQVNVEGRRLGMFLNFRTKNKKQGATGITTVAPYIAGQWGRGNNRLSG
jgi:hypothetical protein